MLIKVYYYYNSFQIYFLFSVDRLNWTLHKTQDSHEDFKSFKKSAARRYECDLCLKSFKTSQHLGDHRRIHTGERPFRCGICHRTFRQRQHLNKHKEVIHKTRKL
ncbi:unnamed protein product [Owenia fusiformis]|uniref:Uncharacterized protein n=1 Tax=Owenia fusiformis TaxID=6347 RepID=A0A8J1XKM7_OWEFU|nr:unnamed protein product [Owenia fusiformis]